MCKRERAGVYQRRQVTRTIRLVTSAVLSVHFVGPTKLEHKRRKKDEKILHKQTNTPVVRHVLLRQVPGRGCGDGVGGGGARARACVCARACMVGAW